MKFLFNIILTLLFFTQIYSKVTYDGYKVYDVTSNTKGDLKELERFRNNDQVDFWSKHNLVNVPVRVMVTPNYQQYFENELVALNISYKIAIEDVKSYNELNSKKRNDLGLKYGDISFDKYLRHDEINAYLDYLVATYPDVVSKEVIGQSYEGRNMTAVKISSGGSGKPMIFSEAGIHAREWIAPSLSLYIINQLVENPDNKAMYENVDWLLLPVANPDGYEYSMTADSYWRKTRSKGESCYGVDGNRNFGFHWGESGADDNECSEIYEGKTAFSEVEVQAMRDTFAKYKDNIKLYVAIHSYGDLLIYPFSYDFVLPSNSDELQSLAEEAAQAIQNVRGAEFTVGNSADILYTSAGCSDDYAIGGAGVPLAYTIEISSFGFAPSEEEIKPIVTENWEGFKVFHQHIEKNYRK